MTKLKSHTKHAHLQNEETLKIEVDNEEHKSVEVVLNNDLLENVGINKEIVQDCELGGEEESEETTNLEEKCFKSQTFPLEIIKKAIENFKKNYHKTNCLICGVQLASNSGLAVHMVNHHRYVRLFYLKFNIISRRSFSVKNH